MIVASDTTKKLQKINFFYDEKKIDYRLYLITKNVIHQKDIEDIIENFKINFKTKEVEVIGDDYEIK